MPCDGTITPMTLGNMRALCSTSTITCCGISASRATKSSVKPANRSGRDTEPREAASVGGLVPSDHSDNASPGTCLHDGLNRRGDELHQRLGIHHSDASAFEADPFALFPRA